MKKAMSRLVGSATVTVLMVACTPVAPLSGNSGGESPRTSAQQTEMAAVQMPAYAQAEAADVVHADLQVALQLVKRIDVHLVADLLDDASDLAGRVPDHIAPAWLQLLF